MRNPRPNSHSRHLLERQRDEDIRNVHHRLLENVVPPDLAAHSLVRVLTATRTPFLITNPHMPGNPIVFACPDFLEMTGYPEDRVLGRNCRFLQGPETDPVAVGRMRDAIDQGKDVSVTLLNYRLDGSTFWNHVIISAVKDTMGEVLYFIGVQHPSEKPI